MESTAYGGQIILANVGGLVGSVVLAVGVGGWGLALYPLVSSIVHVAHGNPGRAAASLVLHIAAPILGALVGSRLNPSCSGGNSDFCIANGLGAGIVGGVIVAAVIDGFMANTPDRPTEARASLGLTPVFSVARSGGATVGLAATF